MDTPLEESNLALIGSDQDKMAREAAAKLELNWEGCGQAPGVEIWRVENLRTDNDTPDFGINVWPKEQYGEFHQGDSYIVLKTVETDAGFEYDIFFWIGSQSSQDEYGVAAYKANELDDLLGDAPIQHRELEGYESEEFLSCFPAGVKYLAGGIESGFRQVEADSGTVQFPIRLLQIRKFPGSSTPRSLSKPVSASSLNQGDAFVLDAGTTVYTWYGDECSPFEKNKAVSVASNMVDSRHGQASLVVDVGSSEEAGDFWELLGGEPAEIASADSVTDESVLQDDKPTEMFRLNDVGSQLQVEKVEASPDNLESDKVCAMDLGSEIIVWIGASSSQREQSQAMTMIGTYLQNMQRHHTTRVTRVKEGQEGRCKSWSKVF